VVTRARAVRFSGTGRIVSALRRNSVMVGAANVTISPSRVSSLTSSKLIRSLFLGLRRFRCRGAGRGAARAR